MFCSSGEPLRHGWWGISDVPVHICSFQGGGSTSSRLSVQESGVLLLALKLCRSTPGGGIICADSCGIRLKRWHLLTCPPCPSYPCSPVQRPQTQGQSHGGGWNWLSQQHFPLRFCPSGAGMTMGGGRHTAGTAVGAEAGESPASSYTSDAGGGATAGLGHTTAPELGPATNVQWL